MKIKEEIIYGFPVQSTNIDPNSYDKKNIIETIEKNFKINKNRNAWNSNSNLHHVYDDWENEDFYQVNFSSLLPIYTNILSKIFETMSTKVAFNFNYKIVNYTCISESQFMAAHDHPECDFNAIHYIQLNNNLTNGTVLVNTQPYINYIDSLKPGLKKILDEKDFRNSWLFQDWLSETKEDDFFLMPSLLRHKVIPQKNTDKLRMTVVLNISITKKDD